MAEGGGERAVNLHPLVIVNISDHFTRQQIAHSKGEGTAHGNFSGRASNTAITVGALFGIQSGLTISIKDSYEFVFEVQDATGDIVLDEAHLKVKIASFAKVFEDFELLGWYRTGDSVLATDIALHKKIMEFNESPLFLLVNPVVDPDAKELPITLNESQIHMVSEVPTMIFVALDFKIETGEAERIAVDHALSGVQSGGGSTLTKQLGSMQNAVGMLAERVRVLRSFLQQVQDGKLPRDHALMREAASVCNQLPVLDSCEFQEEFFREYNDAMLVTYLASVTKGANAVNLVVDKFLSMEHGKKRRGAGGPSSSMGGMQMPF